MNKNVAIVSLGSGGTMGHMALTTNLADTLIKKKRKVFLLSEHDYSSFSNTETNIKYIKLPQQKHTKSVGGCISYDYKQVFISKIRKLNVETLIFSTFYDLNILKFARKNNIKTLLVSYPLRGSHRQAMKLRGYYSYFDRVFTLQDIPYTKKLFPNEEIVSPLPTDSPNVPLIKKKVLVSCGGGGRPSSKIFFGIMKKVVPKVIKKDPNVEFIFIKGNNKDKIVLPNTKLIKWSTKFSDLILQSEIIISEAGYFTLIDLISLGKSAILIPGERRIDNQELRAVEFAEKKAGFVLFPVEHPNKLADLILSLIENPKILKNMKSGLIKLKKKVFGKKRIDKAIIQKIK